MAKLGKWEVDPVICNYSDGPTVLTLLFEYASLTRRGYEGILTFDVCGLFRNAEYLRRIS